jgi:hypothetical protein
VTFCDFEADDRVRLQCTETKAKKLARGASTSRARCATLARLSAGRTAFVSCYSPYRYPFLDSTIVCVNGRCSEIGQNITFDLQFAIGGNALNEIILSVLPT